MGRAVLKKYCILMFEKLLHECFGDDDSLFTGICNPKILLKNLNFSSCF